MPTARTRTAGTGFVGDRRGVTLTEILLVVVLIGILAGVAVGNFSDQRHGLSIRSAENGLLSLHGQARAMAVEQGVLVRLEVDSQEDSVSLVRDDGSAVDTVRTTHFRDRFNAEVVGDWGNLSLCMTPRGFADISCNSFNRPTLVGFVRGDRTGGVVLEPLGQAERWGG